VTETPHTPIRGGFRKRIDTGEDPRDAIERTLLAACLHDKNTLRYASKENAVSLLENSVYAAMLEAMIAEGSAFSPAKYIGELAEKDAEITSSVLRDEDAVGNAAETVRDCIKRLKQEGEENRIAALKERLNKPDLTAEERNAVLKEITERIRANK
jgi:hypothetical protein